MKKLLNILSKEAPLFESKYHGLNHWKSVNINGHYIGNKNGADLEVVTYFSFLHDCMRETEGKDILHGANAVAFIKSLPSGIINLTNKQKELLMYAVEFHCTENVSNNSTIGACWDADRHDLIRFGITPKNNFMSTHIAKELVIHAEQCGKI